MAQSLLRYFTKEMIMTIDPEILARLQQNVDNIESTSFHTCDPMEILIAKEEVLINDNEINPNWRGKDG